jgi:dCMP deaminase
MMGASRTTQEEWDRRFMRLAREAASWSKDPDCQVGALVVAADKRRLSPGYNGFPPGIADLPERLADKELKNQLTRHAEPNALDNAGFDVTGATLYVTRHPCGTCAQAILSRRIARLVCPRPEFNHGRWGPSHRIAVLLLEEAGVAVSYVRLEEC